MSATRSDLWRSWVIRRLEADVVNAHRLVLQCDREFVAYIRRKIRAGRLRGVCMTDIERQLIRRSLRRRRADLLRDGLTKADRAVVVSIDRLLGDLKQERR